MITAKERIDDHQEVLQTAIENKLQGLWSAIPAIIQNVNYAKQTLTAQPAIQGQNIDKDGNIINVNLPLLVDVPFQTYGGSGFIVTVPNLENSECLIVFASRCIDGWWANGGVQPQIEFRMHDLSDGFAIIGFNSQARLIPNYSTTAIEVRTFDGATKIGLTAGAVTITAANTHITGALQVDGAVTTNSTIAASGNITGNGTSLHTHTHSGVQSGSGNTGAPN